MLTLLFFIRTQAILPKLKIIQEHLRNKNTDLFDSMTHRVLGESEMGGGDKFGMSCAALDWGCVCFSFYEMQGRVMSIINEVKRTNNCFCNVMSVCQLPDELGVRLCVQCAVYCCFVSDLTQETHFWFKEFQSFYCIWLSWTGEPWDPLPGWTRLSLTNFVCVSKTPKITFKSVSSVSRKNSFGWKRLQFFLLSAWTGSFGFARPLPCWTRTSLRKNIFVKNT